MEKIGDMLSAEQYYKLYVKAFGRLEDISRLADETMQELEELQMKMGDESRN